MRMDVDFSQDEKLRYARQTILPMIGEVGQGRLKSARVLFVGAGGLGSAPAMYLAAAGVGTIGLIDADLVSLPNLHRQLLYGSTDLGRPKVLAAAETLARINPHVQVVPHRMRLTADNAPAVLAGYDLIIDGTDNLPSRYLINDACFFAGKPFAFGSVHQFEGHVSVFGPGGPCYRCIFRDLPPAGEMPSCAEAGVFGVVPGIIGLMQANEAIKWICGIGESLLGRLLVFDALIVRWRELRVRKDPDCPLCGVAPTIRTLQETTWECSEKGGPPGMKEISVQDLKRLRDQDPDLYLLDVREPSEWDLARIEGSHLRPLGTLEGTFREVPRDRTVYCYCHTGRRSAQALAFLRSQGYTDLVNVKGGIQAWSEEIDPTVPRY